MMQTQNLASTDDILESHETNPNKRSPVWIYTTESFLYRMLNNSLRVQDIGTLYKLR